MIQDLHPETVRIVPAGGFDVREFARTAHGSHRAELGLEAYTDAPLDNDTLQVVDLLARLERGALSYLRTVLVTPAHSDARVTGFLVTWAYEKYWVADALELVLAAHPGYVPSSAPGVHRLTSAWRALDERFEPMRGAVVANLIGEDVIAVHTAAGAIDEWIIQAAYERLFDQTTHPGFARTLAQLLDVKRRHGIYFAADASDRLAASPRAGRLARRRLARMGWPLGATDEPPALISRLLGEVVPASDLAGIDARVDTFPRLGGLDLLARAARRARKASR
ncbi:MAG: hypothetical protein ACOH1Y_05185 [Propionicimonas sp.]